MGTEALILTVYSFGTLLSFLANLSKYHKSEQLHVNHHLSSPPSLPYLNVAICSFLISNKNNIRVHVRTSFIIPSDECACNQFDVSNMIFKTIFALNLSGTKFI
jgi:hypothetical protein